MAHVLLPSILDLLLRQALRLPVRLELVVEEVGDVRPVDLAVRVVSPQGIQLVRTRPATRTGGRVKPVRQTRSPLVQCSDNNDGSPGPGAPQSLTVEVASY